MEKYIQGFPQTVKSGESNLWQNETFVLSCGNKQNYEEKINKEKENIKYTAFKAETTTFYLVVPVVLRGNSWQHTEKQDSLCETFHIYLTKHNHWKWPLSKPFTAVFKWS